MGRRVLIITSLPEEYEAVRSHLHNVHKELEFSSIYGHKNTTTDPGFEYGIFNDPENNSWNVGVINASGGNAPATLEIERAIQRFQPGLVLFVGIAGGLRKTLEPGDVVVATKIYTFEHKKTSTSFIVGQEIASASYALEQKARLIARSEKWRDRLHSLPPDAKPKVCLGPIIAGETGIASESALYSFLMSSYNDTLALEMEGNGYGFIDAIQENSSLPMLVIRGITKVIYDKGEIDPKMIVFAARHASAFAFELIAMLERIPEVQSKHSSSGPLPQISVSSLKPADPIRLFFTYADEDEPLAQRLQRQLSLLKRTNVISSWSSGLIAEGEDTALQLEDVNKAEVILLLISANSLYSDEFSEISSQAMERQRTNGATVLPVLLSPTPDWEDAPLGSLRALPRGGKAVTDFEDVDEAFMEIATEIRTVSTKLKHANFL